MLTVAREIVEQREKPGDDEEQSNIDEKGEPLLVESGDMGEGGNWEPARQAGKQPMAFDGRQQHARKTSVERGRVVLITLLVDVVALGNNQPMTNM